MRLSRRYRFSASHRLHMEARTEAWNLEVYGKCNNPFGHGHNYAVQVTVAGRVDRATGMVVDLGAMDGFAAREVLGRFDCANLNEDRAFRGCVPSTENLCVELWRVFLGFVEEQAGLRLERVRVEETGNNSFEYFGEGGGWKEAL